MASTVSATGSAHSIEGGGPTLLAGGGGSGTSSTGGGGGQQSQLGRPGGMDELRPLVLQLTNSEQVRMNEAKRMLFIVVFFWGFWVQRFLLWLYLLWACVQTLFLACQS